jgi:class 3 adenylate cyclase
MCHPLPPPPAGFTRIAALMSPGETMQLLDRLFQRFDTLATAHGIYKARARAMWR